MNSIRRGEFIRLQLSGKANEFAPTGVLRCN